MTASDNDDYPTIVSVYSLSDPENKHLLSDFTSRDFVSNPQYHTNEKPIKAYIARSTSEKQEQTSHNELDLIIANTDLLPITEILETKPEVDTSNVNLPKFKPDVDTSQLYTPETNPDVDTSQVYPPETKPDVDTSQIYTPETKPDVDTSQVYTPETKPDVDTSQVYTPETNSDVDTSQVYTPETKPDVDTSQVYTPETKPDVDTSQVYTPETKPDVDTSQVYTPETNSDVDTSQVYTPETNSDTSQLDIPEACISISTTNNIKFDSEINKLIENYYQPIIHSSLISHAAITSLSSQTPTHHSIPPSIALVNASPPNNTPFLVHKNNVQPSLSPLQNDYDPTIPLIISRPLPPQPFSPNLSVSNSMSAPLPPHEFLSKYRKDNATALEANLLNSYIPPTLTHASSISHWSTSPQNYDTSKKIESLSLFEESIVNRLETSDRPQSAMQLSTDFGYSTRYITSVLNRLQNLGFVVKITHTTEPPLWTLKRDESDSEVGGYIDHFTPSLSTVPHELSSSFSNKTAKLQRDTPPSQRIRAITDIPFQPPKAPHELSSSFSNKIARPQSDIPPPQRIREITDIPFQPPKAPRELSSSFSNKIARLQSDTPPLQRIQAITDIPFQSPKAPHELSSSFSNKTATLQSGIPPLQRIQAITDIPFQSPKAPHELSSSFSNKTATLQSGIPPLQRIQAITDIPFQPPKAPHELSSSFSNKTATLQSGIPPSQRIRAITDIPFQSPKAPHELSSSFSNKTATLQSGIPPLQRIQAITDIPFKPPKAPHELIPSLKNNRIINLPHLSKEPTPLFQPKTNPVQDVFRFQTSQSVPHQTVSELTRSNTDNEFERPKAPHELIPSYTGNPAPRAFRTMPLLQQNAPFQVLPDSLTHPPISKRSSMESDHGNLPKRAKNPKIDIY